MTGKNKSKITSTKTTKPRNTSQLAMKQRISERDELISNLKESVASILHERTIINTGLEQPYSTKILNVESDKDRSKILKQDKSQQQLGGHEISKFGQIAENNGDSGQNLVSTNKHKTQIEIKTRPYGVPVGLNSSQKVSAHRSSLITPNQGSQKSIIKEYQDSEILNNTIKEEEEASNFTKTSDSSTKSAENLYQNLTNIKESRIEIQERKVMQRRLSHCLIPLNIKIYETYPANASEKPLLKNNQSQRYSMSPTKLDYHSEKPNIDNKRVTRRLSIVEGLLQPNLDTTNQSPRKSIIELIKTGETSLRRNSIQLNLPDQNSIGKFQAQKFAGPSPLTGLDSNRLRDDYLDKLELNDLLEEQYKKELESDEFNNIRRYFSKAPVEDDKVIDPNGTGLEHSFENVNKKFDDQRRNSQVNEVSCQKKENIGDSADVRQFYGGLLVTSVSQPEYTPKTDQRGGDLVVAVKKEPVEEETAYEIDEKTKRAVKRYTKDDKYIDGGQEFSDKGRQRGRAEKSILDNATIKKINKKLKSKYQQTRKDQREQIFLNNLKPMKGLDSFFDYSGIFNKLNILNTLDKKNDDNKDDAADLEEAVKDIEAIKERKQQGKDIIKKMNMRKNKSMDIKGTTEQNTEEQKQAMQVETLMKENLEEFNLLENLIKNHNDFVKKDDFGDYHDVFSPKFARKIIMKDYTEKERYNNMINNRIDPLKNNMLYKKESNLVKDFEIYEDLRNYKMCEEKRPDNNTDKKMIKRKVDFAKKFKDISMKIMKNFEKAAMLKQHQKEAKMRQKKNKQLEGAVDYKRGQEDSIMNKVKKGKVLKNLEYLFDKKEEIMSRIDQDKDSEFTEIDVSEKPMTTINHSSKKSNFGHTNHPNDYNDKSTKSNMTPLSEIVQENESPTKSKQIRVTSPQGSLSPTIPANFQRPDSPQGPGRTSGPAKRTQFNLDVKKANFERNIVSYNDLSYQNISAPGDPYFETLKAIKIVELKEEVIRNHQKEIDECEARQKADKERTKNYMSVSVIPLEGYDVNVMNYDIPILGERRDSNVKLTGVSSRLYEDYEKNHMMKNLRKPHPTSVRNIKIIKKSSNTNIMNKTKTNTTDEVDSSNPINNPNKLPNLAKNITNCVNSNKKAKSLGKIVKNSNPEIISSTDFDFQNLYDSQISKGHYKNVIKNEPLMKKSLHFDPEIPVSLNQMYTDYKSIEKNQNTDKKFFRQKSLFPLSGNHDPISKVSSKSEAKSKQFDINIPQTKSKFSKYPKESPYRNPKMSSYDSNIGVKKFLNDKDLDSALSVSDISKISSTKNSLMASSPTLQTQFSNDTGIAPIRQFLKKPAIKTINEIDCPNTQKNFLGDSGNLHPIAMLKKKIKSKNNIRNHNRVGSLSERAILNKTRMRSIQDEGDTNAIIPVTNNNQDNKIHHYYSSAVNVKCITSALGNELEQQFEVKKHISPFKDSEQKPEGVLHQGSLRRNRSHADASSMRRSISMADEIPEIRDSLKSIRDTFTRQMSSDVGTKVHRKKDNKGIVGSIDHEEKQEAQKFASGWLSDRQRPQAMPKIPKLKISEIGKADVSNKKAKTTRSHKSQNYMRKMGDLTNMLRVIEYDQLELKDELVTTERENKNFLNEMLKNSKLMTIMNNQGSNIIGNPTMVGLTLDNKDKLDEFKPKWLVDILNNKTKLDKSTHRRSLISDNKSPGYIMSISHPKLIYNV